MFEDPLIELMEYVRGNTMVNVAEGEAFPEGVLYTARYVLCHTLCMEFAEGGRSRLRLVDDS